MREVAIIGQPDEKWGDAVTAVIVLIEGMAVTEDEIKEFCRNKLARFKVPKFVDFVDELPKNATGKILRKKVREPYWKKMEDKELIFNQAITEKLDSRLNSFGYKKTEEWRGYFKYNSINNYLKFIFECLIRN